MEVPTTSALRARRAFHVLAALLVAILPTSAGSIVGVGSTPERLGVIDQRPRAIEVVGDLAYIAHSRGLSIVDVQDRSSPVVIGEVAVSNVDLVVEGEIAYVADSVSTDPLRIVDVSDPTNPTLVTNFDTGGRPRHLGIEGGVLVVGQWTRISPSALAPDFRFFDLTNPTAPVELGQFTPRTVSSFELLDGRIYTAGIDALEVIDFTDPTAPFEAALYEVPVDSLDLQGDMLYAIDFESLLAIDISDRIRPSLVGSVPVPGARRIAADGNIALVGSTTGLQAVDITNPSAPVMVGEYAQILPGHPFVIDSGFAYVAEGIFPGPGIRIVDLSQPDRPVDVGALDAMRAVEPGAFHGVEVRGTLAYVSDGVGLRIFDVSAPATPALVGELDTAASSALLGRLTIVGNLAYVVEWSSGLVIVDASDPSAPIELGRIGYDFASAVQVVGSLAYVAMFTGVVIVDVSDPTAPTEIGSTTSDPTSAVEVEGSTAYVLERGSTPSLQVVDVTDPTAPVVVASAPISGGGWDLDVAGSYAYVAGGIGGDLVVVDLTNPLAPAEVARIQAASYATTSVEVVGNRVLLADGSTGNVSPLSDLPTFGIRVVDISDPTDPLYLGGIPTHSAGDATASNGLIYASTGTCPAEVNFQTDCSLTLHVADLGPEYVPEPSTAAQAAVALLAILGMRRRGARAGAAP
jgi:hypothetical protein